ncbi:MAG: hypothetical protein ABIP03_01070 [Aquihabitans sp.]
MAKTSTPPDQLRKGNKVVARTDMRDVPEGTEGKVIMVAGFTWVRYWVRFDNGIYLGTINRHELATPEEWKRHLSGEDEPTAVAGTDDGDSSDGGDTGGGGAGGVTTVNGTFVPQRLIDMAKAARTRLAA